MDLCKLQSNGLGGYTPESIEELRGFICDAFLDAELNADGENYTRKLKTGIKKALYKIAEHYDLRQINEIINQINFVLQSDLYDCQFIADFLPEAGLYNTLKNISKEEIEEKTQASYQESENTKEEIRNAKSQFLENYFGTKVRLKNQLKQNVTHKLLSTFIIDRQNGKIITNIGEANRAARAYKSELLQTIFDYMRKPGNNPFGYNIPDKPLYDGDIYTGVLSEIKQITRHFDDLSPQDLQKIHDTDIEKYNAITAWFTLRNFDRFVDLLLGDVIKVHPNHRNSFKDGDGYAYSTKGSQVITTWRTSDNIVLENEIGALAQSLINSTPFYKFGIDNKTDKFIKFEDFYRMITKLKQLALNPESRKIIIDEIFYGWVFDENSEFTKQEQDLLRNKSLRSIINNIRLNPQVYTRLAMRILVHSDNMKRLGYKEEEMDKTYSIYKGFFENNSSNKESVYRIQSNYDHNVKNYYSLITQVADSLFTVDYLQYYDDNGIVGVRTLKDQSSDNLRRRIEQNIQGFNSRQIIGADFEIQQMLPFNMSPILNPDTNKFEGINYKIITNIPRFGEITVKASELGNSITFFNKDGIQLKEQNLGELLTDSAFLNFIDSQLNLDLKYDKDLLEALKITFNSNGVLVSELLQLASTVYMNKYISNVLLKNIDGRKNTLNKLEEIFGKDSKVNPGFNSTLGEMSLIPEILIPKLERIAEAVSITTGEAQSAQVKDSEGNMLSSQTLSRLLGALQTQWESILRNPNAAAKDFSIIKSDMFKGCFTTKDFKSALGNKEHTKFTVAESFLGNFLYDFVGGFLQVDNTSGKKIIGNGVVGLLPSVNSDKNTIGRMLIDLSQECNIEGLEESGRSKKWAQLTTNELLQVMVKEIGGYYQNVYNNVVNDFKNLETWLAAKGINVIINPDTDFRELNDYCEQLGISTAKWLFDQTNAYNKQYPTNPIRLIEQTHYVKNGKGIKVNNTLRALKNRFNDISRLSDFMNVKRTEVLKSLIDENIEINLFDEDTTKNTPKRWLQQNYPEWVHGEIENGKMVLAKLTYRGKTYRITGKQDLESFTRKIKQDFKTNIDFLQTPHKLINPKFGINVELHPMLDKYNTMDYLFTQEFMIAGVGSHINHKAKANYQTPILFGNISLPSDKIMSWEEEFIPRFERFLNQNELVKDVNNPIIKDFISKEWERIKQLANSQNKALIVNDEFIYHEFESDFTKIGIDPYSVLAQLRENEIQEEAARFLAQHKRNVSYTAAMHEFQLGTVNGIPTAYNMAIIDDITAPVYTISGDTGEHAPFDGATFVNPWVVIWENNSLEGDRAGIDKKPFIHFYDEATGTGGIVKTAGFGLTNDRIRRYQFYRDMIYNMTNKVWRNSDGSQHIPTKESNGILQDFNKNRVEYGPVYFRQGNKYFMREIVSYEGDNKYLVRDIEVDEYGQSVGSENEHTLNNINSNYRIWEMFGGHNSMELKDKKLVPSEKSIELTARAANNYGTIKEGVEKVLTADDVIQPMKYSDIHYMPTVGAIKQGMCNINPASYYYGKHDLNFMQVKMIQAGIQLDKEHHADNSELSLMTQVISAACANGYSSDAAKKLYNAIYALTKAGTAMFRNELGNMLKGDTIQFDNAVTKIIMEAMLNSTSQDGDLVQIIARDLLKEMRSSNNFSFDEKFLKEAKEVIPYSDPTIYNKIVNMLTVALTKSGIKTKMPGILAVLCPSHEILKFYKIPVLDESGKPTGKFKRVTIDKAEQFYKTSSLEELDRFLDEAQNNEELLPNVSAIEMGYKYLVEYTDAFGIKHKEVLHINKIHGKSEKEPQTRNYNGEEIIFREISYNDFKALQPSSIKEWVKEGQDLRSYNVRFKDEGGHQYQIADLDIVQDYFKIKEDLKGDEQLSFMIGLLEKYGKTREFVSRLSSEMYQSWGEDNIIVKPYIQQLQANPKLILQFCDEYRGNDNNTTYKNFGKQFKDYIGRRLIHFINRQLQITLDGISPKGDTDIVIIGGQPVKIVKESIKTSTYGLVMPKTFKSNLGLDEFDELEDIKNDPQFFVRKLADKFGTKVEIYENENGDLVNNYHVELKRSDGNHVYVRTGLTGSDLEVEVDWIKRVEEDGTVYRIDGDGKIIYQMHSASDKIYKDHEGNEIIITSNLEYWVDEDGNKFDIYNNKIELNKDGTYTDVKTKKKITKRFDSGMQFYLDTMGYNSFSISRGCTDNEFRDYLSKAKLSSNKRTAKLANNISRIGKGKNSQEQLIAQRELVNAMNDYHSMLENTELKDFALQHLQELGQEMYVSFLRSLQIIAARIPAQSQQSFMSMEVEAYENPDVNSAYVSLFQFYLQGSDLDIDAVSLQTFELDRNGLYVGHSPYYSLNSEEMRKISDLIPFPSGVKTELSKFPINETEENKHIYQTYNTLDSFLNKGYFGILNKEGKQSLINLNSFEDGTVEVTLNIDTPENLLKLVGFLNEINEFGLVTKGTNQEFQIFAENLQKVFGKNIGLFTVDMCRSIILQIKGFVDKHNLYIQKSSAKKREQIIKNYVTLQLRDIIDDPINRRQADSSVDVVTGPAKALAKLSPKATVQITFTPGNVINKFQSISENMVGKDGIAICATGLKTFFATTEMYHLVLNEGSPEEKISLLFDVSFKGKKYRGLANGFSKGFKNPYEHTLTEEEKQKIDASYPEEVQQYLVDQFWASDAANEMSALLGLSTDNAKELVLAKINAGTATIGMYLYGLSIGIPFEQLFQVMTSPLAFRLAELTKGNYFNNDKGTTTITGALNYLKLEPINQLIRFDAIEIPEDIDFKRPSTYLYSNIKERLEQMYPKNSKNLEERLKKGTLQALVYSVNSVEEGKRILDSLALNSKDAKIPESKKNNAFRQKYIIQYNQAVEFAKQYLDDAFLVKGGTFEEGVFKGSMLEFDLEVLATGAEEMKQIGKILRLNQEVKTNSQDLLNQVANIEESIIRRARKFKDQLQRKNINKSNFFNHYPGREDIKDIIFAKDLNQYKIDLEKFLTDSGYAEKQIKLYDTIKQSYNPLRILKTVPHYRGYAETLLMAYKGAQKRMIKFNLITTRGKEFINEFNVNDSNLQKQVIKNVESGTDLYIRQEWMKSKFKPITISATGNKVFKTLDKQGEIKPISKNITSYCFIDSLKEARVLYYDTEIQLGTPLGDANFKLLMETQIIPILKQLYPDNIFIKGLQPTVNLKTNIGSISINYGLPINMLPKTDYERDLFNEYKEGFNQLISYPALSVGKYDMSIQDLLYCYSLIANNGKNGPNSLHGIFEDYLDREIPKSYRSFISNVDSNQDEYLFKIKGFLSDEILAPMSSPYTTGSLLIRYKDKDSGQINLYEKEKKEENNNFDENPEGYPDEYPNPFDDMAIDAYYEQEQQGVYDSKEEINGFKRKTSNNFHNADNRNYFTNPVHVEANSNVKLLQLSDDEIEQYPALSKFEIQFTTSKIKGKLEPVLVNITAKNPNDKQIVSKYLDHIKTTKGAITTIYPEIDGKITPVINKEQLNSELQALEDECI